MEQFYISHVKENLNNIFRFCTTLWVNVAYHSCLMKHLLILLMYYLENLVFSLPRCILQSNNYLICAICSSSNLIYDSVVAKQICLFVG